MTCKSPQNDSDKVPSGSPSEHLIPSAFGVALLTEMQAAANSMRAQMLAAGPLPPVKLTRRRRLKSWWYWKRHDARYRLAQWLYPFDDC